MSRAVAEIIDLMGEIEVEVLRRKTAMQEIERAIEQVEDGVQREVLRWRYLTNLNMEEIAGKMGYSRMQVSRIHGRALEAIRSMLEQKSGEETEKGRNIGKKEGRNENMTCPLPGKCVHDRVGTKGEHSCTAGRCPSRTAGSEWLWESRSRQSAGKGREQKGRKSGWNV